MSKDESPSERLQRLWADPEISACMREGALRHRLKSARKRRDAGEQPFPLDNLTLTHFGEGVNPREVEKSVEPMRGMSLEVLRALQRHSEGLTAVQLKETLGLTELQVRAALNGLREKGRQPIINNEGRFRLLRPGEY
ncbi:hypothetical protein [Pseudomonas sp. NW5]|uniref:hypothetical protein n=1 Tax=Pseudomonas sp. NW5 TaxID=2934934 RepID=UPI00201FBD17|nr:hypothetical protein [Pseudomonas sp. NW5]MCL7462689.1 hypothetical protein [Pseudomonas sp. NW5]